MNLTIAEEDKLRYHLVKPERIPYFHESVQDAYTEHVESLHAPVAPGYIMYSQEDGEYNESAHETLMDFVVENYCDQEQKNLNEMTEQEHEDMHEFIGDQYWFLEDIFVEDMLDAWNYLKLFHVTPAMELDSNRPIEVYRHVPIRSIW